MAAILYQGIRPAAARGVRASGALNPYLPTSYAGLLAWYAAPPKSLIASPSSYVTLTVPSITAPSDMTNVAWTKAGATASTATLLKATAGTSVHDVSQTVGNCVVGRTSIVSVDVAAGTWDYVFIQLGNSTGLVTLRISTSTVITSGGSVSGTLITPLGGGSYRVTFQIANIANTSFFVGLCSNIGALSWAAAGTETATFANMSVTQDGVVGTLLDLRTRWPGLYKGKIDPSTGLPYVANDATQGAFGNMPYYDGVLGTHLWGTGAPTIYNPGTTVAMNLALPSALVSALSGINKGWEVIALLRLYGTTTGSPWGLLRFTGAGAVEIRSPRVFVSSTQWGRYRENNALVVDSANFSTALVNAERAVRYNWQSTGENLYVGASSPLVPDVSNPLIPTATGATTVTSGILFYNGGATTVAVALREAAIFQSGANLSDVNANNIATGMFARSLATA